MNLKDGPLPDLLIGGGIKQTGFPKFIMPSVDDLDNFKDSNLSYKEFSIILQETPRYYQ